MLPTGHLASAYLLARRPPAERLRRLAPIALGVMTPDVIDKGALLLHLTPYGRTVGHAALVWAAVAGLVLLVASLRGREPEAVSLFVAGGVAHLLVDLADDFVEGVTLGGPIFAAWAGWPLTNPDMLSVRLGQRLAHGRWDTTVLELATLLGVLVLSVRDHRATP